MKLLVYGAGVVGSLYAAQLHLAGHEVSLLARGRRLEDLREHGVVLEDVNSGERTVVHPVIVDALRPEDEYDLVLVVMQCIQVPEVLQTLAEATRCDTVLFLGNCVSGSAPLVEALGRDRVLRGFGGIGGTRSGHVIRYFGKAKGPLGRTTIGEIDGRLTPRLARLQKAFADSRLPITIEKNIDSWLKSHAAAVVPLALALYLADGEPERLARTRDGIVLALRSVRELFEGLRTRGVSIEPGWLGAFEWVPEPVLIAAVRRLLRSTLGEVALAGHADVARDEMNRLADDLADLVAPTEVPTTAFEQLRSFSDPAEPPMVEGRKTIPLDWRGVWAGVSAVAAAVLILRRVLVR